MTFEYAQTIKDQADKDKIDFMNRQLALWLREIHKRREACFVEGETDGQGNWKRRPNYSRRLTDITDEVVGADNPIGMVIDCLFTAGYCEMWDFCDQVLGPEEVKS